MPENNTFAKAEIREIDSDPKSPKEINKDKWTVVQFNPDSLKVTFANQVAQPQGGGDQNGPQAQQFVGSGSTKLAVQLYFDVTSEIPAGALANGAKETNDVRVLTQRVAYFITPVGEPKNKPKKFKPPIVRFRWGSFKFDGIMEGMEETLELFSADGRPLRASVSITLAQQRITAFGTDSKDDPPGVTKKSGGAQNGNGDKAAGSAPMTAAPADTPLQRMTDNAPGSGLEWQAVASFNGIENPRILVTGQLLDLDPPKVSVGIGLSIGEA